MSDTPDESVGVGADDLAIPDFLDRRPKPFPGDSSPSLPNSSCRTRAEWSALITESWLKSVEAIVRTGQLLNEAKAELGHGNWQDMARQDLPFSLRQAEMLMRIAKDARLAKNENFSFLPPSVPVLYQLTKLDDQTFDAMRAEGFINPSMTKLVADNAAWVEKQRKVVRFKKARRASPPKKPAKITPQDAPARGAPARRPLLPPTAANDLLETAVRLSADLGAWPGDILAVVRLMPIEDRRKLGEVADKIVNWWLRVHDAATPNKEFEI